MDTASLTISDVTGLDGNTYSVIITHAQNNCISLTASANLTIGDPCDPVASGNPDTDGDGVADVCDLDDDNDGILDTVEGSGNSDGDGLINSSDLDSDGDGCNDVIEAGHDDADNDGILGSSPVTVDANGQVTGQGGYTGTNSNVTTPFVPVSFDTQPTNETANLGDTTAFTANVSGGATLTYQWQESTDNGSSWNNITNGGIYSGATTNNLTLTSVTSAEHDNDYRLVVTSSDNDCGVYTSDQVDLFIRPDLTVNDASTNEGGTLAFVITPSHTVNQDITFDLTYTDVSTTASDYTAVANGTISAGSGSATINVVTVDDTVIEPTETFILGMTNANTYAGDISDTAIGTISDNDSSGSGQGVSVSDFTIGEGDGTADFLLTYTGPDVQESFTVNYLISDNTATSGSDYTATLSGFATFPAGTTDGDQQAIAVTILDDTDFEVDETLNITLTGISIAVINFPDANGEGTIQDDDSAGYVEFSNNVVIVTEGTDTFARFTVNFVGSIPIFRLVRVDYTTADVSAVNPGDYSGTSGTLTFHSLNYSDNIDIPINDDNFVETQEAFELILSNIQSSIGAVFASGQPTETAQEP